MSSSAAFQYDDGGNQQPPQTFPNKYIYEEFYGYKGFQYLDTIISKIVSLAYYRTWLKAIKYQIDENMPYIGTARIAEESERSVRKIYMDQQGMQRKGLLSVMPGIVTNKDGKARAVLIKDFSGLYKLAHEYHEWIQAGGEQIFPPNREYIDAIRANPHVYKKIVRYENYRRILLNKRPGRKCTTEQADLFTGEEEFDLQNLNLFTNISVNQDSPYRVYQPNNLTDKENSNSRTHHQEYKDEVSQEEISIPEKEGFWEQEPEHSYYDYEIHIAHEAAPQAHSADYMNYDNTESYTETYSDDYYMNHPEEYEEAIYHQETQQHNNNPYLPPADYHYAPNDPIPPSNVNPTVGEAARRSAPGLCNNKQASGDNYTSYYGVEQGHEAHEPALNKQERRRRERAAARAAHEKNFKSWEQKQYKIEHPEPEPQLHPDDQEGERQAQDQAEQPNMYKQYREQKQASARRKRKHYNNITQIKPPTPLRMQTDIALQSASERLNDQSHKSTRTYIASLMKDHENQIGKYYDLGTFDMYFASIIEDCTTHVLTHCENPKRINKYNGHPNYLPVFYAELKRRLAEIENTISMEMSTMDQSNSSSMEYSQEIPIQFQETSQLGILSNNCEPNTGNIVIDSVIPKSMMVLPENQTQSSDIKITLNSQLTEQQFRNEIHRRVDSKRREAKKKIQEIVISDTVTIVAEHMACQICGGRIQIHNRCVSCYPLTHWLEITKEKIQQVIEEYIPNRETLERIFMAGSISPEQLGPEQPKLLT